LGLGRAAYPKTFLLLFSKKKCFLSSLTIRNVQFQQYGAQAFAMRIQ
jgi:hypothetical protein